MNTDKPGTISLYRLFELFLDEESARLYFGQERWPDGISCPHCGLVHIAECKDHRFMPYRCLDCRKHFSVRTGSVLAVIQGATAYVADDDIHALHGPQGRSLNAACQRERAWHHPKDRLVPRAPDSGGMAWAIGHDEVDETHIGGKEKNKHKDKKLNAGRRPVGKQTVVGMKERDGRVFTQAVESTDAPTLQSFVEGYAQEGATVYTDEHRSYQGMTGYNHEVVNHCAKEFVHGMAHTNVIESFWALLKRGYYGVYHYMSKRHLRRYINGFSFRFDTAKVNTM